MKSNDSELVGGPQDGGKVTIGGSSPVPDVVFLGPKWLGDGYAAWSRVRGATKPAMYVRKDGRHYYTTTIEPLTGANE